MKNNFPTFPEAEELEETLLKLAERKRRNDRAMRRLDAAQIILLVNASVALGILIGLQLK